MRAPGAPVLVRVGAVGGGIEPRILHHVDPPVGERRPHVLGIRVVPGDDGIEALVAWRVRVDGVLGDAMPELAQPLDRSDALARVEVVEHRLRHQEVRRRCAGVALELGHPHGGVEREVDVVAQDHGPPSAGAPSKCAKR